MSAYPLDYEIRSTRQREESGLLVDITSSGAPRARQRHGRYRFDLVHTWLTDTERTTLQDWLEANEGTLVQVTWSDGRTYEGLLGIWSIDERAGPRGQASVEIRGAKVLP